MAEEKIVDTLKDKPSARVLFEAYYSIPVVHYSPSIMAGLSQKRKAKWTKFTQIIPSLEQLGVKVILVPLSLDKKNDVWWVDYEASYIKRFNLNPTDQPYMSCVIKIDDNQHYLTEHPIAIQHGKIKHKLKKQVLALLDHKWFSWDGKQQHVMTITL